MLDKSINAFSEISSNSGELKNVNREMVTIMANLSEISYSINSSIGEINGGMKDIAEGISEMDGLSKDLDQSMVSADEQLNRFKLSV